MTAAPAAAQPSARAHDDIDACLAFVKHDEGGYAERALEPGGAVNMGISFAEFSGWRHLQGSGHPSFADLKAMTWDEARAIYRAHYAVPCHFDALPPGVNYVVFDSFINNGPGHAVPWLREALGFPTATRAGRPMPLSPDVLWAAGKRDPATLVNAFCDARLHHQKSFKNYGHATGPGSKHTFGEVWDRRVTLVRGRALAMIADHQGAKA